MKKNKTTFEKMNEFSWVLAVLIALTLIGRWGFNETFRETVTRISRGLDSTASSTSSQSYPYNVGWSVVAKSQPTFLGGGLYGITWECYKGKSKTQTQSGTAITSYPNIKIGDKVWVEVSLFNSQPSYHITEWKPSSASPAR